MKIFAFCTKTPLIAFAAIGLANHRASAEKVALVPVVSIQSDADSGLTALSDMAFVERRLAMGFVSNDQLGEVRILEPSAPVWAFSSNSLHAPNLDCRRFGLSLAADGSRLAVGSASGHIYVFDMSIEPPLLLTSWHSITDSYAQVLAFEGETLLIGLPSSHAGNGGGVLLQLDGNSLSVIQDLAPQESAGKLGWSGGMSGDTIVLSAEESASNSHAMTWQRQPGGNWTYQTELHPSNPAGNPIFGCSSSIENSIIAIGARDDSAAGYATGACYVFEPSGSGWVQTAKLTVLEPPFQNQETGGDVVVKNGRIWISSGGNMENGFGDRGRLLIADKVNGFWQVTQTLRSEESGLPTFWGYGVTFGPNGAVGVFGYDSPIPFSSWRLRCDIFAPQVDCDNNGIDDLPQIWESNNNDADTNNNGIPDTCECGAIPTLPACCPGDLSGDHLVDGADIGLLLSSWGYCVGACPYDLNHDGMVNGGDLGLVLSGWGTCGN